MPRPLKKPTKREPQAVTVRRLEDGEPIEVIAPDELARRKQEAEWQLLRRSHGLDLADEHELLALKLGAAIIVESYTGKPCGGSFGTSTASSARSRPGR